MRGAFSLWYGAAANMLFAVLFISSNCCNKKERWQPKIASIHSLKTL
ncbi:hypothetical protein GGR16_003495 [Chelatococcus caeni]|uniref:Uncharacterized protein n=1 Tax=Chelatococcus caeni TaxID=1348468 RepID=A0A840C4A6_9HYPH|nr:hypothetical protein [Chelatococcus caeni]